MKVDLEPVLKRTLQSPAAGDAGRLCEAFCTAAHQPWAPLLMQANQILDLGPGEVFVQRNVGNLATHKDMNCMACVEYTVDHLKVKHIMVVGHYNCGAPPGPWDCSFFHRTG